MSITLKINHIFVPIYIYIYIQVHESFILNQVVTLNVYLVEVNPFQLGSFIISFWSVFSLRGKISFDVLTTGALKEFE